MPPFGRHFLLYHYQNKDAVLSRHDFSQTVIATVQLRIGCFCRLYRSKARECFTTLLSYRRSMLKMGRWLTIEGYYRPTVFKGLYLPCTHVNHRLYSYHQTFSKLLTIATAAIVRYLRVFMQLPAYTMPYQVFNHTVAMLLGRVMLYRKPYIPYPVVLKCLRYPRYRDSFVTLSN